MRDNIVNHKGVCISVSTAAALAALRVRPESVLPVAGAIPPA